MIGLMRAQDKEAEGIISLILIKMESKRIIMNKNPHIVKTRIGNSLKQMTATSQVAEDMANKIVCLKITIIITMIMIIELSFL